MARNPKYLRIEICFTPEQYDLIKSRSKANDIAITEFIKRCISHEIIMYDVLPDVPKRGKYLRKTKRKGEHDE